MGKESLSFIPVNGQRIIQPCSEGDRAFFCPTEEPAVGTLGQLHFNRIAGLAKNRLRLYQANPEIRIVVPEGIVATLIEDGIPEENIVGMNDGDKENFDNLEVAAFSAAHPEILKDEQGKDLNLGYEMKIGPVQIAHLGDTLLCEELIDHLEKMENPDCMIVPINGQDYFRTARNCIGNLSPYEAVMAGKIAQAGQLIPCHYDMIMGNTCSVLDFVSNMEEHYPQGTFAIPRLGERLIFKKEK